MIDITEPLTEMRRAIGALAAQRAPADDPGYVTEAVLSPWGADDGGSASHRVDWRVEVPWPGAAAGVLGDDPTQGLVWEGGDYDASAFYIDDALRVRAYPIADSGDPAMTAFVAPAHLSYLQATWDLTRFSAYVQIPDHWFRFCGLFFRVNGTVTTTPVITTDALTFVDGSAVATSIDSGDAGVTATRVILTRSTSEVYGFDSVTLQMGSLVLGPYKVLHDADRTIGVIIPWPSTDTGDPYYASWRLTATGTEETP